MASIQNSSEPGDSLAGKDPQPPSEISDMIPLPPTTNEEADSSSSESSCPSTNPRKGPSKARAKKIRKVQQKILSSSQPRRGPLRPAKDILSRIRHDPALDDSDFIVGYHDRHADVMEIPVTLWTGGGDVTEEEFIPQHRILYFRRKSSGVRVWDRKARIDLLFGSGLGDGEKSVGKRDKSGGKGGDKVLKAPTEDESQGGTAEEREDGDGSSDEEEGSTDDEEVEKVRPVGQSKDGHIDRPRHPPP